jgi:hypothetical protein
MDAPLPKRRELTCQLLLDAWCVFQALAHRTAESLRVRRVKGEAEVRAWALAFPRRQLETVLKQALGEAIPAAAIVEFVSWRPGGYKGLWGKPLAAVPGENVVCLARSILTSGYAPRRAEIWLQDGGLADELTKAGRGGPFEAKVRRRRARPSPPTRCSTTPIAPRMASNRPGTFRSRSTSCSRSPTCW